MDVIISQEYENARNRILQVIRDFEGEGEVLGPAARNTIKIFNLEGERINVKSFKVPNLVNRVAYRFFRKSKAERSYTYAHQLLTLGIGTPFPIAYAEEKSGLLFKRSYYMSQQLESDLTYRNLVQDRSIPQWEAILRAFTRFTYSLHEKGVEFLDHSPGNTLIRINQGNYEFFLVDLNRMNFRELSFEARMKNFSRLTPEKDMVAIMASEYSNCSQAPEDLVFERMWHYTETFQRKFWKKKAVKKKLKFWKS